MDNRNCVNNCEAIKFLESLIKYELNKKKVIRIDPFRDDFFYRASILCELGPFKLIQFWSFLDFF